MIPAPSIVKIQHASLNGPCARYFDASSFTGSPLARTSATMERICRTRTPSAISTSIWSSVSRHFGDLADQTAGWSRRYRRDERS